MELSLQKRLGNASGLVATGKCRLGDNELDGGDAAPWPGRKPCWQTRSATQGHVPEGVCGEGG